MTKKFSLRALAAIAVAGALALTGCGGGGNSGGGGGGDASTLKLGILGDISSWDPSQAHVGHALQPYQAPFDTLLLRSPEGELEPMLAESWEYNEDNTVLTLTLRDDVTFTDGEAFNADAAKANLERFPTMGGRQAPQLASVESIEALDETTLVLNLSAPDPALTYYLSQAAGLMASPAQFDSSDVDSMPIGSGPYVMDSASSQAGSIYTFTKNEDYWNPDLQKFDSVEMRVLTDATARLNALQSGQIDATLLDTTTAPQAKSAGKQELIYYVDWNGLILIDRDGELNPAIGDVKVRQALNYAFDRDTLLETLQGGNGEVTSQPFGVNSGAYDEALDTYYTYDPDKAKELLAEAGYADGFTLSMPAYPGTEQLVAVLQQQLADIGVTLDAQTITAAEVATVFADKKYPIVPYQLFQGSAWVNINQWITTSSPFNPFGATSPELQADIDAVQMAGEDPGEAGVAVNEYVVENAWFVPFYRVAQLYYYNDNLTVEPQVEQAVPSIYNYAPAA